MSITIRKKRHVSISLVRISLSKDRRGRTRT